MSKFVTLVLEPRFKDEYGEYANLPVFNAHGDVVGYTGGEVPETGNPCEFYVMDEEGFPVCHSASENTTLRQQLADVTESMGRVEERCAKLREEIEAAKHDLSMFSERIVELDADNAKLCMRVASLESALEGMHLIREMDLAENAKLRELVDELYPLADYGAVDASELDRAHDLMRELGMHDFMRELGVEVDG